MEEALNKQSPVKLSDAETHDNRTMAACKGGSRLPLQSSMSVNERKRREGGEG